MDTEYSKEKVFEILGKTVYLCQEIEYLFKFIVSRATITQFPGKQKNQAVINSMNEKMQSKANLSMSSRNYFNEIYGEILENPETSIQISYRRSGDEESRKIEINNVITIRNDLVHTFSRKFGLTTENSRNAAITWLNDKYKIIENEYNELKSELEMYRESANIITNFVNSPAWTIQPLIWIHSEFKDKEGWVSLSRAGQKLRENRFNSPELLQQIQEKGLLNFIKAHGFFEVKNENNNCKYRVLTTSSLRKCP
jgi:hypothetical protein